MNFAKLNHTNLITPKLCLDHKMNTPTPYKAHSQPFCFFASLPFFVVRISSRLTRANKNFCGQPKMAFIQLVGAQGFIGAMARLRDNRGSN